MQFTSTSGRVFRTGIWLSVAHHPAPMTPILVRGMLGGLNNRPRGTRGRSRDLRNAYPNLRVDHRHFISRYSTPRLRKTASGDDVEFHGVPGADDDLPFAHPGWLPSGFGAGLYRSADRTSAQRPILVKAVVGQRVVPAPHIEDSDFAPTYFQDFVSARG